KKAAEAALKQADLEKQRAETALDELKKSQDQVNAAAYAPLIRRAIKLMELKAFGEAEKVLAQCGAEQRGWEWAYLTQRCKVAKASPRTVSDRPYEFTLATKSMGLVDLVKNENDKKPRVMKPSAAAFYEAINPGNRYVPSTRFLMVLAGDRFGIAKF